MLQTSKKHINRLTLGSQVRQSLLQVSWKLAGDPPRRYNITISDDYNFVWFRVAKVGTRSILAHLREHCVPLTAEHPTNVIFHPGSYRDHYKFAFVRNPWQRFLSAWRNRIVDHNTFNFGENKLSQLQNLDTFVDEMQNMPLVFHDLHFKPQSELIDLNHVDFIGRFESFEADIKFVFDRLNIPTENFPHRNKSSSHVPAVYTRKTASRVFEIYRRDFEIFYPTLRSEYLKTL